MANSCWHTPTKISVEWWRDHERNNELIFMLIDG